MENEKILVGNSFPLSLIRRGEVRMTCPPLAELRAMLVGFEVVSFWGHENTRAAAEEVLGVSLKPKVERPVLKVASDGCPSLEGESFKTCWVLSPDYVAGFRPGIGQEVGPESITGWSVVKMEWL